jgi:hypothetical protein
MTRRNMFKALFVGASLVVGDTFLSKSKQKLFLDLPEATNCCLIHGHPEDKYMFFTYHDKTGKIVNIEKFTQQEYKEYFSAQGLIRNFGINHVS